MVIDVLVVVDATFSNEFEGISVYSVFSKGKAG